MWGWFGRQVSPNRARLVGEACGRLRLCTSSCARRELVWCAMAEADTRWPQRAGAPPCHPWFPSIQHPESVAELDRELAPRLRPVGRRPTPPRFDVPQRKVQSFLAESSFGKWPRCRTVLRSELSGLPIWSVVYTALRALPAKAKTGVTTPAPVSTETTNPATGCNSTFVPNVRPRATRAS